MPVATGELPFLGKKSSHICGRSSRRHLRFGEAYRAEVEQAIKTYLNANVVEIDTNDTAQAVTGVRVASLSGNFWFQQSFLAVGGIENPRLLLVSTKSKTLD